MYNRSMRIDCWQCSVNISDMLFFMVVVFVSDFQFVFVMWWKCLPVCIT